MIRLSDDASKSAMIRANTLKINDEIDAVWDEWRGKTGPDAEAGMRSAFSYISIAISELGDQTDDEYERLALKGLHYKIRLMMDVSGFMWGWQ